MNYTYIYFFLSHTRAHLSTSYPQTKLSHSQREKNKNLPESLFKHTIKTHKEFLIPDSSVHVFALDEETDYTLLAAC